ncbi:valine--tRNA ligase [Candidatus Dojkabacteria bacterium HGW-Dojkabacteria-1]|uniref:Valine--tRNA ligase n=1 Tax=Candidatus Dojkabacteria bacterium HGW-Dojkabacteria-1 TaxID=2013761 RepID=A0A2N2F2Q6_9BACT|nr:MAG: valine--tRNA ligase [Candidatus Dojkabacteria bacterium HGW-Dojkabacteria-1]
MKKEIPKAFDSNSKEKEIYKIWENSGLCRPEGIEELLKQNGLKIKSPFTIVLPPPNANANLHIGHMCGYSFQDAMGRYQRMTGHPTLLLPGKDHAGIQTETSFTKVLKEKGIDKWEMGKEEFYKQCYAFSMGNASNAREQEKNIGLSADYTRELFTLDPKLTKIVYDTFYKMYKEGLIYRDKRIINQCPNCKTALADIDTEHEERRGIFAYIVYPFVEEEDRKRAKEKFGVEGITVATTRPETMLGDSAVAVNPQDTRYKEFVGKKVLLPIANREIPIIADSDIDIELGTGALKVTPAHSPVDFEIGKKHGLEIINVINEEGKMTGSIPERFLGMETVECSKALVKELSEKGLLIKIENIKHEISICERCRTAIEPIISNQWYVDVNPLAKKALEVLKQGETTVIPSGQQKALEHFFNNIQPWCISRQLWWGQRIPVWYSGSKKLHDWLRENEGKDIAEFKKETGEEARGTGEIYLGENAPDDFGIWEAEEDMFDTWFSSGQWPYSTLGGIGGEDYKKYYPTQVMETARDILFWWVARMMMMGIYTTGKTPFSTVFLHGLILAADGSKMSKSKGNGVEPTEVINKYGADALRLWYFSDALPGSNAPVREEKIKGNRNFVNKIWNASRFILMNIDESELEKISNHELDMSLSRIKETQEHTIKVLKYLEKFQFNLGAEAIREFFWHQLCDIWIEEIKGEIKDEEIGSEERVEKLSELLWILKSNLKIMHPFVPFITESVWQELVNLELAEGILMGEQIS